MQILMLDARSQAKLKFISSPSKAQHNAFETVLRRDGKPVRQSGPILTNLFESYAVTDRKDYLLAADFTTRTQNDNLRLSGYLFGTVFQHSRFPDARIAPDFDIAPAVESHTNLSDPLVPCQHHTAHAIADVAEGAEQVGQAAAPRPWGSYPRLTRAGVARPFSLAVESVGGFYAGNGGTSPAHTQPEDYTNF